MRMGQGVRTGLGHGGIICVLQTQFSSFILELGILVRKKVPPPSKKKEKFSV